MCPSVSLIVHLSAWAFTNSLAQKLSRNFSFYGFAAGQNGFTSTRILTPKQSIILTKTLTLTRALNNRIHVLLAWHVTKTIFLPITLQGSIFILRHGGWFGISVQKYTDHFHTLRAFSQEFS